jgi:hypothetical protein
LASSLVGVGIGGAPRAFDRQRDLRQGKAVLAAHNPRPPKRIFEQALFKRLLLYDERLADAEVAKPFATLADPDLLAWLDGEAVTRGSAYRGDWMDSALEAA